MIEGSHPRSRGASPETILKAERGVASPGCGANRTAGGQGSRPAGLAAWRGKPLTAPVFHSRRRRHRSQAENRHGGAPREVPFATGQAAPQGAEVAPRTRDKTKECACRRSIHHSFGVMRMRDATRIPKRREIESCRSKEKREALTSCEASIRRILRRRYAGKFTPPATLLSTTNGAGAVSARRCPSSSITSAESTPGWDRSRRRLRSCCV